MTILRLSGGNYIFLKLPVVVEPHFKFGFSVSKAKIPNFYHMSLLFLLYLPHVFEWGWTGEGGGDTLIRKRQIFLETLLESTENAFSPQRSLSKCLNYLNEWIISLELFDLGCWEEEGSLYQVSLWLSTFWIKLTIFVSQKCQGYGNTMTMHLPHLSFVAAHFWWVRAAEISTL